LCRYITSMYRRLKRSHEQKQIYEISKYYSQIQYADTVIQTISDILDKETIEYYEIYRDSVKQTILRDIDSWIDGSFNFHPFCIT
jgi:hypothetical protein